MFIDVDNRRSGKTTTLIMDSYFTGLPIVVANHHRAVSINNQAEKMGVTVKVYTVEDLGNLRNSQVFREIDGVLVDELEDVLYNALGVKVVKANMSRQG